MTPNLTSIIIPIFNTDYPLAHYTGNAIGSVKEHTREPYEIIVVDNGSTIELGGWKWDKAVDKYIKNRENLGVPKAWNGASHNPLACRPYPLSSRPLRATSHLKLHLLAFGKLLHLHADEGAPVEE